MIKLKYKALETIRPLLKEYLDNAKLGKRCDIDYAMSMIGINMVNDSASVYVDKEADPTALLVLTFGRGSVLNETSVVVNVLTVSDKVRLESPRLAIELTNEMFANTASFASSKGADTIRIDAWIFRGAVDIEPIITRQGFEPQSKAFVKILNPQLP